MSVLIVSVSRRSDISSKSRPVDVHCQDEFPRYLLSLFSVEKCSFSFRHTTVHAGRSHTLFFTESAEFSKQNCI